MLTRLSIRNVVLIEALDLDMKTGLTALTGETGAGKSIILDALGMATGARSDRGLIRLGADKAQCTAAFTIGPDHAVFAYLSHRDIDCDPHEDMTLRRVIGVDGRSKAFINDMPVSVKLLNEVGSMLLEVHGQNDGRGLLDPLTHINLLDQYGAYKAELTACQSAYKIYKAAEKHYKVLTERQNKSSSERDFLTHAIAELDRLDPREGEAVKLAQRRKFLQSAEGALSELSAAQDILGEGGAFEDRLASALASIDRLRGKFEDGADNMAHQALGHAAQALERALLETQDARQAVAIAAQNFDVEPGQLDETEKRLFAMRAASRKYDCDIERLISKRAEFAQELTLIDSMDSEITQSQKTFEDSRRAYEKAALTLNQCRHEQAERLDKAVSTELGPLKMERAIFKTQIEMGPVTAFGHDTVRFVVATNPGSALGPLDKIASGGEMARFALAIKAALAGQSKSVMVFDEVDQGVGGAVADAVGRRLARLSKQAQVFVVTHSPQVAACADQQFRIEKHSHGSETVTQVHAIRDHEREEEIARMLAGETITSEARAAARQLINMSVH